MGILRKLERAKNAYFGEYINGIKHYNWHTGNNSWLGDFIKARFSEKDWNKLSLVSVFGTPRTFWFNRKENKIFFIALLAMVTGAVIFYSILLFGQEAGRGKQQKSRLRCRIGKVFHIARILFGVVFFIVYIGGLTKAIYNNHYAPSMEEKIETPWTEARLEEYLTDLSSLRSNKWEKLSFEERIDLMETIIEIEQQYLGISHPVELKAETLDDNTLGYYSDNNKLIVIESELMNYATAWNAVKVVCHEMRHAYQYRLIDVCFKIEVDTEELLFFREVENYFWEMICYIDGNEDFEAYHNQKIEVDAREYADERIIYYMQKLEVCCFEEE